MYNWRLDLVIRDLKSHSMSGIETLKYLITLLLAFICRITVFNILPLLYYITFSLIKKYLEQRALPAQLIIDVYTSPDAIFNIILAGITFIGFTFCFIANKKADNKQFLKRFISLGWVINTRIVIVSTFLFYILIICIGAYIVPELQSLQPHTSPALQQPLSFFLNILKKLHIIKHINTRLETLQKAHILYKRISDISLLIYIGTHITTLIFSAWYFYRIKKCIVYCASMPKK